MRRPIARQPRGIALITAVFVVALATIAATALLASTHSGIQRAQTYLESESAWWYAQGLESWGTAILELDAKETETDSLADIWAQQLPPLPVEGGTLVGSITDLQGLFNVNNLAVRDVQKQQIYLTQLNNLLTGGCIDGMQDVQGFDAGGIANAIKDWIDADDEQSFPGGGEDLSYLSLTPSYRAANRPMQDVSELLAVQGMTPELYRLLRPHLTALPEETAINVNTATPAVLCALAQDDAQRRTLESFVETREEQPLENLDDLASPDSPFPAELGDYISVTSNYFQGRAAAFIGSGRVVLYSLIRRPTGGTPIILGHSTDSQ